MTRLQSALCVFPSRGCGADTDTEIKACRKDKPASLVRRRNTGCCFFNHYERLEYQQAFGRAKIPFFPYRFLSCCHSLSARFYYFLFYFEVLHSCCVFSFPPFVGFPALFLYSPVSCLLISLCVYSLMSLPWCCHGFCVFFSRFFFGLLLKFPLCSQLCLPPESLAFGSSLFLPIVTYRYSVVLCQNCNYIFLLSLCCHHFFKQPSEKLFKGALS